MNALTARQLAVRACLRHSRDMPLTVREIAERANAPMGGVRAVLKQLESRGLVERRGVALDGGATWRAIA